MMEIRFDKTKDEVALLIWFLVDHSVEPLCKCYKEFAAFRLRYFCLSLETT
jgi:hypothetical protein